MRSEHYHPDLRGIARLLPRSPFTRVTLPAMRALTRLAPSSAEGVDVVTITPSAHVRLHRPEQPGRHGGALLWIHGGGYVIGTAAQDDALCRRFSRRLGVPVASVDYRLAPRDPYPAALEDCYSALTWLARQPGVDSSRIAIGGASAGGGLAAALALLARDRGEVTPIFQLLVYPMVDDRPSGRPGLESPHYRLWSAKSDRLGWQAYLKGADRRVAVPARHEDLSDLPAAWVGVGTVDPLYGQDVEYAHRLRDAGVDCQLDIVEGAFHGFDIIASKSPVAQRFFARQCEALRAAFEFPKGCREG
ncbi:alpha/beta hydrolase [Mycobacterium sp. MBM]|nr:alpha/beta hydrolase [Mycobacterium sp. MBM]